MREAFGDIWEMEGDLVCVTTNCVVNRAGEAVMGGGCAREARDRYPGVAKALGDALRAGQTGFVHLGRWHDTYGFARDLAAFPTKDHWRDSSDRDLIGRSARQLMEFLGRTGFKDVLLPRPGCGLGNLDWDADVYPVLRPILDDRVVVVGFESERA